MGCLKTCVFFLSLLRTSIRSSISLRGAFLLEVILMVGNNLIFLLVWWIFFKQFKEVAGWTMRDVIALNVAGTGAYGLMQICFGGVKDLSRVILTGDLDPFMTQPKNLLLHLMGSKSLSRGWGDIATAIILACIGNFKNPSEIALLTISAISGCLVFASVGVAAHSLAFWLKSAQSLSKKYCDSLILFALYPTNIYSGVLRVVMFTLLPAGIIGYLPVELLRAFSWVKLVTLLASSAIFLSASSLLFYGGLKKYQSGNQFGMRL